MHGVLENFNSHNPLDTEFLKIMTGEPPPQANPRCHQYFPIASHRRSRVSHPHRAMGRLLLPNRQVKRLCEESATDSFRVTRNKYAAYLLGRSEG